MGTPTGRAEPVSWSESGRAAKIRFFDKDGVERFDDAAACHPFVDVGIAIPGTLPDGEWLWSLAMIDTGLSVTLVDQSMIAALGMEPAGYMDLNGIGGTRAHPLFKVDIRLDQALVSTSALVGGQTSAIGHASGVKTLIGLDILRLGRLVIESPATGMSCFEFQHERISRP
jgi:hypothetical protein